jgi:hypothetical protein
VRVLLLKLFETVQFGHAHPGGIPGAIGRTGPLWSILADTHFSAGLRGRSCRPRPGAGRSQFVRRKKRFIFMVPSLAFETSS